MKNILSLVRYHRHRRTGHMATVVLWIARDVRIYMNENAMFADSGMSSYAEYRRAE